MQHSVRLRHHFPQAVLRRIQFLEGHSWSVVKHRRAGTAVFASAWDSMTYVVLAMMPLPFIRTREISSIFLHTPASVGSSVVRARVGNIAPRTAPYLYPSTSYPTTRDKRERERKREAGPKFTSRRRLTHNLDLCYAPRLPHLH